MKVWLLALILALIPPAFAAPAHAASPMLMGVGKPPNAIPPPAYTGPGDIQPFFVYGGMRAYSSATRGTAAIIACTPSDASCATINSSATDGTTTAGLTTLGCASVVCTIKEFFEQAGAVHSWAQAVIANRATVTMNCLNTTLPCATFGGSAHYPGVGTSTVPQTFTIIWAGERTGSLTSQQNIFEDGLNQVQMGYLNAANTIYGYAGSVGQVTASDSAYHVAQLVFSNGSSALTVDATTGAHAMGANSWSGAVIDISGQDTGRTLVGNFTEFGVIAASGAANTMATCSNINSFWALGITC